MKKLIIVILILFFMTGCSRIAVTPDEITTKPIEEERVEEGKYFHITGNNTLTANSIDYFMGCTDSREVNFIDFELDISGAPFYIQFSENPTITNNGTLVASNNMNRNSNLSSSLQLYFNPVVTDEGDIMFLKGIYGGYFTGADFTEFSRWILKNETCYLFKIENGVGASRTYYSNFFWHEE
jgi:hypothetical protein